MKAVGIFCGANDGVRPEYYRAAEALVDHLVSQEITIVYGGGNIGLMGVVANRALARGGKVIGVIPQALVDLELVHNGLSELILVENMHDRKARMSELSDAFIVLSGGSGSMDEWFQEVTLRQAGYHDKTCSLLNTAGYYDHLLAWLKHSVQEGFLKQHWFDRLIVEESPARVVERLLENAL